jgi:hypothetical protein
VDDHHFDMLTRAFSVPETRRRLFGALAAMPIAGGLFGLLGPEEAGAGGGRRKRRKKRHKHGKGRRRRNGKHKKACKPQTMEVTCAGKCGSVRNNCKKTVDCGPCTCDPACGACERCNGVTCEACDRCCDGVCCTQTGAICHLSSGDCCLPDSRATTCDGKCGQVVNNCGVTEQCGPCACQTACADCETCDEDTGECVADPTQQGDPCGAAQTCSAGTVTPQGTCNASGSCVPGTPTTCAPYTCSGNTCGESCTGNGQCVPGAICCGGECVTGVCCQAANCAPAGDTCDDHQCRCGSGAACTSLAAPDCCTGGCTNLQVDHANCGACGHDCADNEVCVSGECVCQHATCSALGKTCGTWPDGCGGTVSCGGCAAGSICDDGVCEACDVCAGGGCDFTTVQDAVDATPYLDTIRICPGAYAGQPSLNIHRSLTLVGAGDGADASTNTILTPGGYNHAVVYVASGVEFHLKALRITGGRGPNGRGVSADAKTLTFTDCTIIDNKITDLMQTEIIYGGGLGGFNIDMVTMTNTRITGNAASNGGGVHLYGSAQGGILILDDQSRITDNEAFDLNNPYAGGVFVDRATVVLPSAENVTGNIPNNCLGLDATFTGPGEICTTN